jgi:hypothetical protein
MATYKKQVRTRFLIFPQFQLKLLGANLLVMTLAAGVIWLQMSRAFSELAQMSATAGASGAEAEFFRRFLEFQSHNIMTSLGLALVAALLGSTLLTLVISHRFSGPLVRLRHYFRDVRDSRGPMPKLSFRKNDFLSDLPPLVNDALERVSRESKAPVWLLENQDKTASSRK